jgi:hypothetical protein
MPRSVGKLLSLALVGIVMLATRPASAEPITFQCTFSDATPCVAAPGIPNAWINPVMGENEPANERSMTVEVRGAIFVPPLQLYNILDVDGSISDQVLVTNDNNRGFITLFSDPFVPMPLAISMDLGTETEFGIAADFVTAIFDGTSQSLLKVSIFSDGEFFFDPFGIGIDSSDGIQVSVLVPEPASWAILILALASLWLSAPCKARIIADGAKTDTFYNDLFLCAKPDEVSKGPKG